MTAPVTAHFHRWVCESPNGPSIAAECACGATRMFKANGGMGDPLRGPEFNFPMKKTRRGGGAVMQGPVKCGCGRGFLTGRARSLHMAGLRRRGADTSVCEGAK